MSKFILALAQSMLLGTVMVIFGGLTLAFASLPESNLKNTLCGIAAGIITVVLVGYYVHSLVVVWREAKAPKALPSDTTKTINSVIGL